VHLSCVLVRVLVRKRLALALHICRIDTNSCMQDAISCVCREPTVEEIAAETSLSVTAVNTAIRSQKRVDGMHSAGGSDAGREAPRDAPTRDVYAAHAAAVDTSGSALNAAEGRMLRRCVSTPLSSLVSHYGLPALTRREQSQIAKSTCATMYLKC